MIYRSQVIFQKILTRRQWFSLILLTAGCMIKQLRFDANGSVDSNSSMTTNDSLNQPKMYSTKNMNGLDFSMDAIYIFIQLVCSCLAGVYNEYLLKGDGARVNIYVQNIFMYVDSIVCNVAFLIIQGNLLTVFDSINSRSLFAFNVIIIMINNAAIGLVTSFFLRYLNSILKTFASALELLFTAVLCYFFFQIPIYLNTVLSIGVVSFAIYLYSLNPVVNHANTTGSIDQPISYKKQEEKVQLLRDLIEEVW